MTITEDEKFSCDSWGFVPHLMLSGGASRNVATWRMMTSGINGMTLGFPAGFSIVFWPKFKTSSPLIFLLLFREQNRKNTSDTLSVFLETPFSSNPLRCAFGVPPLEVRFSSLVFPLFFLLSLLQSSF